MEWDWTHDWRHIWVSGDTGAGKTTVAKQLAMESDRVTIFWQPISAVDLPMPDAKSPGDIISLFRDGHRTIAFRPSWDEEEAVEQFEELVNLVFRLAEHTERMDWQVIVDECHQVAPKGDRSNPLVRLVKEGRNYDIKTVSLSQEPQLVSHSVLRQSRRHLWGGQPNAFAEDYFKTFHVPTDELRENGEHTFTVMNENMEVIGRFEASREYW